MSQEATDAACEDLESQSGPAIRGPTFSDEDKCTPLPHNEKASLLHAEEAATADSSPSQRTLVFMCACSIFSTMSLIILNKACLTAMGVPSAAGVLSLLHYMAGFAFIRSYFAVSGRDVSLAPWTQVAGIAAVGCTAVVTSNITLQYASVAFHQLSRLVCLPLAATLDYFLYGKKKDCIDLLLIAMICAGVYMGSRGDVTVTPSGVMFAMISQICTVGSAALIKRVMQQNGLSSSEFMYQCGPYSILSALVLFLGTSTSTGSFSSETIRIDSWVLLLIAINLAFAVSVQYLSTWLAGKVSGTLYAALANAKTVCTVAVGALTFDRGSMNPQVLVSLIVCLGVVMGLSVRENSKTFNAKKITTATSNH